MGDLKSSRPVWKGLTWLILLPSGCTWMYFTRFTRELPLVPEVFSRVRWRDSFCRPQADTGSAKGWRYGRRSREKKPLAESALIYHARWTLILSLICQSNRRSRDCWGTTRSIQKSHINFRKTRWRLKIIANLFTVQFSIIYVASVSAAIHSSKFGS